MPILFIRTVNKTFVARDDGRDYADVQECRSAAISAAADIAHEEIEDGHPSVIIEGYVEEEDGTVRAKVAVAMCVGDIHL